MKGKSTFTEQEVADLRRLITEKQTADRDRQKALRGKMRSIGFYITDFVTDQRGFTASDFDDLVARGTIVVEANGEARRPRRQADLPREEPRDGTPLGDLAPVLVERCKSLNPGWIILSKATVFDATHDTLEKAGLPVSTVRIPFPGSGRQKRFLETFERALTERSRASRT